MILQNINSNDRQGASMIELLCSLAVGATLMIATITVLRSTHTAWKAHENELSPAFNQSAVHRHIVQHVRQAGSVSAISNPTNNSGNLTIQKPDGTTYTWSLSGGSVNCSVNGGGSEPIADEISSLSFTGFEANPSNSTTTVDDIQSVRCFVGVNQPLGGNRTTSSYSWLRAW